MNETIKRSTIKLQNLGVGEQEEELMEKISKHE